MEKSRCLTAPPHAVEVLIDLIIDDPDNPLPVPQLFLSRLGGLQHGFGSLRRDQPEAAHLPDQAQNIAQRGQKERTDRAEADRLHHGHAGRKQDSRPVQQGNRRQHRHGGIGRRGKAEQTAQSRIDLSVGERRRREQQTQRHRREQPRERLAVRLQPAAGDSRKVGKRQQERAQCRQHHPQNQALAVMRVGGKRGPAAVSVRTVLAPVSERRAEAAVLRLSRLLPVFGFQLFQRFVAHHATQLIVIAQLKDHRNVVLAHAGLFPDHLHGVSRSEHFLLLSLPAPGENGRLFFARILCQLHRIGRIHRHQLRCRRLHRIVQCLIQAFVLRKRCDGRAVNPLRAFSRQTEAVFLPRRCLLFCGRFGLFPRRYPHLRRLLLRHLPGLFPRAFRQVQTRQTDPGLDFPALLLCLRLCFRSRLRHRLGRDNGDRRLCRLRLLLR